MKNKFTILIVIFAVLIGAVVLLTDKTNQDQVKVMAASSTDFLWFEYDGHDDLYTSPLPNDTYYNPILAGYYPDPTIIRVENTFYLANSSFAYFPGVPIFKSTNLVDWQSLGYVLDRPSQVTIGAVGTSKGIFAPTLRYHQGTYYLITTNVDGPQGNFIVTATDPAGDWSDPILLPEVEGIDPDIFFDDDGRVYIAHNGPPEGEPAYGGHRAIWLWEFDLQNKRIVPDSGRVIVDKGVIPEDQPIWIEGPHLYKHNGWYYLMCAEGGTAEDHSEVIFRSRSLTEPFTAYAGNPILTQRNLPADRVNPITSTGHADIVETTSGEWWAVFLGIRPYDGIHHQIGRETFLLPVTWQDGWPIILPHLQPVPNVAQRPALPPTTNADLLAGNFNWRDDFNNSELAWQWNYLRNPVLNNYLLSEEAGLKIKPTKVQLNHLESPSFIGRRQQHNQFTAKTEFTNAMNGVRAGLTVYQNEQAYLFAYIERNGQSVYLGLEKQEQGKNTTLAQTLLKNIDLSTKFTLYVQGDGADYRFKASIDDGKGVRYEVIGKNVDGVFLSTQKAGGFVGNYIGLHAYTR